MTDGLEEWSDERGDVIRDLSGVLNAYGIDSALNVPDFVLAEFCWNVLSALGTCEQGVDKFYGRTDPREKTTPSRADRAYAERLVDVVINTLQGTDRPRRAEGDAVRKEKLTAAILVFLLQNEKDEGG